MKANDVFKITLPNGVEVECVAITKVACDHISICGGYIDTDTWLCYAQNRLFRVTEQTRRFFNCSTLREVKYLDIVVDYCMIPLYDDYLNFHNELVRFPEFHEFIKTRRGLKYLCDVADILSDENTSPGKLNVECVLASAEAWYHESLVNGLVNGPL